IFFSFFFQAEDGIRDFHVTGVQTCALPISVTVRVTLFGPKSAQVKSVISIEVVAIPQASVLPPSTSAAAIETFPVASRKTVMFWQTAVGATLSSTVTTVVQVLEFPLTSVTVSVTVFEPTSAQVKSVTSMLVLAIAQLSALPLSTSAAVILAIPLASSWTVNGAAQLAAGASLSFIVISMEQLSIVFPLPSNNDHKTVVVPTGYVSEASVELL